MAQILVSRELAAETPHQARTAARQQAMIYEHAELLGLSRDYHPAVEMQSADLYLEGPDEQMKKMIKTIMESFDPENPHILFEIEVIVSDEGEMSRYERIDHTLVIALN